jgi:cyclic 2,3-diphosphoglycerate synthase
VVVVDGEHYPPVVSSALATLQADGHEVALAVMVGGREKLPAEGIEAYGDIQIVTAPDARDALVDAIDQMAPDEVLDLSDEPVLDYRKRFELASIALEAGVGYRGSDFSFTPPERPALARKPSLGVIGTGKRTGKTAIAGFAARTAVAAGYQPVVVAMGRGGPEEPEVLRGDEISLSPSDLLAFAEAGKHAASDYIEDALLSRVLTIGCRRCGGGLAGAVSFSNVHRGVEIANEMPSDLMIMEGSGAALPPVATDVNCLVVPASIPEEYLRGYFGPYRLLLADVVMVTMCEEPFGSPSKISSLTSLIHEQWRRRGAKNRSEVRVVRTVFRPKPVRPIEGASVFVATTAPEVAGPAIGQHLAKEHGCTVVGISHSLSDRKRLVEELKSAEGRADVLLCEIKAAAVDVATRWGLDLGLQVVYMDNIPVGVDGDDPEAASLWAAQLATERFH